LLKNKKHQSDAGGNLGNFLAKLDSLFGTGSLNAIAGHNEIQTSVFPKGE